MTFDTRALSTMPETELSNLERAISKERKDREKRKRQKAAQELKEIAQKHNLPISEIVQAAQKTKKTGTPRFQHPSDQSLTWTGQGRKPKWVTAHLEQGGSLEDLRIPS